MIRGLFDHSRNVVSHIGRWEGARRPAPAKGTVRLTFLVADGLHLGEGSFNALYTDPMGSSVIDTGVQLMEYLTRISLSSHA